MPIRFVRKTSLLQHHVVLLLVDDSMRIPVSVCDPRRLREQPITCSSASLDWWLQCDDTFAASGCSSLTTHADSLCVCQSSDEEVRGAYAYVLQGLQRVRQLLLTPQL